MNHVALLGDSIFDNRVYVAPAPDVGEQLRSQLGRDWTVSLVAVDGHVASDVRDRQIARVPDGTSHIVISVGGNDALGRASILNESARSVAEAVGRLAEAQARFAQSYGAMIDAVLTLGLPTAVCTIYDANYPEPHRRLVVSALSLFNDAIMRVAFARGLDVVDLRLICDDPADYANPIEPSARGGEKIAKAIADLVRSGRADRSSIWT
ncbi:GDSL-type esterase/lipase family protein [Sphingomonas sp. PL-96]|uniref:SGNH/GDSL hydrolase family protein n=1 Tax=Sphingomonas sp. PL-96 TaxID=2887201 RepID=UPI001E5E418A|nr:GDSL-type esterase/lipase family protein [Sphingomonas sp. PL-96]MCC2978024.1 GDSL-type esterase/lipase family protein [Sphingomonas sp. PL-96]